MKNILNCHVVGLHSFLLKTDANGFHERVFCTDVNHKLWIPDELAIHPHRVDIMITVLEGTLTNIKYVKVDDGGYGRDIKSYKWDSHILNGKGGFKFDANARLRMHSEVSYNKGESFFMKSCELHTVRVDRFERCVWKIEESAPSCGYDAITYSNRNLERWDTDGLYVECDNRTASMYLDGLIR